MKLHQKTKVLGSLIDIMKTVLSGMFVWLMIKQLFPTVGDHEESRNFLVIMVMCFIVSVIYASITLADMEKRLLEMRGK